MDRAPKGEGGAIGGALLRPSPSTPLHSPPDPRTPRAPRTTTPALALEPVVAGAVVVVGRGPTLPVEAMEGRDSPVVGEEGASSFSPRPRSKVCRDIDWEWDGRLMMEELSSPHEDPAQVGTHMYVTQTLRHTHTHNNSHPKGWRQHNTTRDADNTGPPLVLVTSHSQTHGQRAEGSKEQIKLQLHCADLQTERWRPGCPAARTPWGGTRHPPCPRGDGK
jgi:hypothetical protein